MLGRGNSHRVNEIGKRPGPICRGVLFVAGLMVLAACDRGDQPLPGERIPVRASLEYEAALASTKSRPISLPAPVANAEWTHQNGLPQGRFSHVAFSTQPQLRWSVNIGAGDKKRSRILTSPIYAGGLVFVMDSAGQLSAVTRAGQIAWTRSVVRDGQRADAGPGGGLAVEGGVLFLTSGFGEVMAMTPSTGQTLWRKQFDGPFQSGPVVRGGRLFAVSRDDVAYALQASNGEEIWRVEGGGGTGLMGGSVPAVDGSLVVLPFTSGELLAVDAATGTWNWGTAISGGRNDLSRKGISDISGDPIIVGSSVYASSQSGRTVRMDRNTGGRLWTISEGAYGPVWSAGGSLFLLSDIGTLVRADTDNGDVVWATQLPEYYDKKGWFGGIFGSDVPQQAVGHFGPVLAGGRLWVASGDGLLRSFSPIDGSALSQLAIPGGAAAAPAVAGGMMFIVSRTGQLHAFQ